MRATTIAREEDGLIEMLGFFRRKDPVCGMTEERNKGLSKKGKWFCSKNCLEKYEKKESHNHCC